MLNDGIYILVQIVVIILIAPLNNGIIKKVKAFIQKRNGAPIFQMYFDVHKLFRKSVVVSENSSWIFKITPYIVFSTSITAALFVPVTTTIMPSGFLGDGIMFIYILALGRFFMILAGLDTGSTFGGMGSSREAMIAALIEPSILVSIFTVGLVAKSTSIFKMMEIMKEQGVLIVNPMFIMTFLAIFVITITETSRIPIDDPATHLELTMVHEAMLLEYSGRHLALMELGASIKQLIFITLLVNIFIPHNQIIGLSGILGVVISLLFYLIKVITVSILIGFVEISSVKFRFFSIPNLAAVSFILSFLGFLQYFILGR